LRKLIPLVILALFITGCGGMLNSKVENAIRDALPGYIGPAKSYDVKVSGSPFEMMKGHLRSLHVQGTDVRVDGLLHHGANTDPILISQLTLDAKNIRVDINKKKIRKVEDACVQGEISEEAVNAYLHYSESRRNISVKLLNNKIVGEMTVDVMGLKMTASMDGRAVVEDGTKISFVPDSASFASVPVPKALVERLLKSANPILDLSRLSFPVHIERVTINQGSLTFSGHAQPTNLE